jgi:hypothetical protein
LDATQDYRKKSFIEPLLVEKKGVDLIHDPIYNKGTAYPYSERDRLNIRGLVPPRCTTIEVRESLPLCSP